MNDSEAIFERYALRLYAWQAHRNPVYRRYLQALGKSELRPQRWTEIPLLPIRFFKTHQVLSVPSYEAYFVSSGTSNTPHRSRHFIASLASYHLVARTAYERQMGPIDQYYFVGLLPSYLDNSHSSLISMVHHFMRAARQPDFPFLRTDYRGAELAIRQGRALGRQVVVFGTPLALLEWIKAGVLDYPDWIIETGGMKGQAQEWVQEALHTYLRDHFPHTQVISEYGMTELLSQSYSTPSDSIRFRPPPWMRVVAIDPYDPFEVLAPGRRGRLGIIDLANQHSIAFIATDDLGVVWDDGSFQLLGRMEQAEVRGCNLLLIEG